MAKISQSDPESNIAADGDIGTYLRQMNNRLKRLRQDETYSAGLRKIMAEQSIPVNENPTPDDMVVALYRDRIFKHILEDPVAAMDTISEIRYYIDLPPEKQKRRAKAYSRECAMDIPEVDKVMQLFDKATRDITLDPENSEHYQQQVKKRRNETKHLPFDYKM